MTAHHKAHEAALSAVNAALEMPDADRREYLEMCGCAAIHYMRAMYGDDYVRGWLEHALSDLSRPPLVGIATPN